MRLNFYFISDAKIQNPLHIRKNIQRKPRFFQRTAPYKRKETALHLMCNTVSFIFIMCMITKSHTQVPVHDFRSHDGRTPRLNQRESR